MLMWKTKNLPLTVKLPMRKVGRMEQSRLFVIEKHLYCFAGFKISVGR